MRPLLTLGLASLAVVHAAPALATTYQVGPSRTLKTLSAVAEQLNAGDVVEVDGDATYLGGVVLDRPGAPGNPITVKGVRVNGKRPVLTGGTNSIEIQGDHYVFQGFEVTGGAARCVYHHADDVTMRDLLVHDCKAQGLLGADQGSGSLTLEYSEFYGSGSGTQDHQIYMATDEVAHPGSVFRMQFCFVHDGTGGNNVKSRAERNEIYYNWIEGALYHELELIGPDPDGAPAGWTEGLKREDSDVVGNVLRKKQTSYVVRFGGDGTGQSNGRYRFVANTVLTEPGGSAVFRLFDGIESVEMHDNVFFVNPGPTGASTIVRDTEAVWSTGTRIVGGSHNWVLTQAASVPPEWTTTVKGADPGFAAITSMNLTPLATGALGDACTCISSPTGHEFPSPLAWPAFEPPRDAAEAPGTGVARSLSGQLYIGAFQPAGAGGGPGGNGGSAGAGGTSSGGSAANGGRASGGASSGGAANANGGASSGGSVATNGGASGGAVSAGGAQTGGSVGANGGSVATGAQTGNSGGRFEASGGAAPAPGGDSASGGSSGVANDASGGANGGCSCRAGAAAPHGYSAWGAAAVAGFVAVRRRARRRR